MTSSVIRSAGLRGFRSTVAELGGDAEEYAAAAGLPVAALDTDDLLISDIALAGVLEIAARRLDCPDLALRIARRQDLGMLGPLALAIANSPTVGDALECTSRYLFVHARSLRVTLEPDPYGVRGVAAVVYATRPDLPAPVQGTDLGLAFVHRAIEFLVGGAYGLRTVELPYTPAAPRSTYEEFFGVPVRTGARPAMLRVPQRLSAHPLAGSDEHVHELALAFLAQQTPGGSTTMAPRVRGALRQSLGTSAPEITSVARLLTIHPRTLQRRLTEEGTGFAAILDDVRRQAARGYLTTSDMPMSQVAALLGLSEQSALTRCSRRWWGAAPKEVRRQPALADRAGQSVT